MCQTSALERIASFPKLTIAILFPFSRVCLSCVVFLPAAVVSLPSLKLANCLVASSDLHHVLLCCINQEPRIGGKGASRTGISTLFPLTDVVSVPIHDDSTFLYTDPPSALGFWFALVCADVLIPCLATERHVGAMYEIEWLSILSPWKP